MQGHADRPAEGVVVSSPGSRRWRASVPCVSAPLPISTPSEQGVDPAGVAGFIDALEAHPGIEAHSVIVIRHRSVVAAGAWWPFRLDRAGLLYSLSKSFTSTALGIAVGDGLVDLDAPVLDYFPEVPLADVPARVRARTVRHIASMRTGHRHETLESALATDPADPVGAFLRMCVEDDPGTVFTYNQPPVMTIAALVRRVTGASVSELLRTRVLDPVGAGPIGWLQYPAGDDLGFSGLFATPDAVARLGLLYLDDGMWAGRQLLPSGWAAVASSAYSDTSGEPFPDWQQGYGLGFWRARHGFRGDGAWGQFCLVLPEQDAVVAITSAVVQMQDVLDAVYAHLLPAMRTNPAAPSSADDALVARLAALALEPERGTSWTPDTSAWHDVDFVPLGGACPALARLTSAGVRSGGRVILADDTGDVVEVHVGDGGASVIVAAGWADAETLLLDAVFADTPHRLSLVCDTRSMTFTAHWRTTPLHATRLRDLRTPGDEPVVLDVAPQ
jgi:CubicO group peptidase (beta-lactamase class C family)